MPQGIITKGIGGFYYVKTDDKIIECKLRGKFRKQKIIPMVGDKVEYELNNNDGVITTIFERKNNIYRPPVSNIDQVILVISVTHPSPDYLLLDKMIALLESKGIEIVICINKIDLDADEEYKSIYNSYEKIGYKIINTSVKEKYGIEELKKVLTNKVSTFAGSSGVGKSSLLNTIIEEICLETNTLSSKIERGKHTTRHVELFELKEGGFVLDTPGFSVIRLKELQSKDLKYLYKEFNQYYSYCKFTGCNHINEPDCAVKQAVKDNEIDRGRYERYKIIFNELKSNKSYK